MKLQVSQSQGGSVLPIALLAVLCVGFAVYSISTYLERLDKDRQTTRLVTSQAILERDLRRIAKQDIALLQSLQDPVNAELIACSFDDFDVTVDCFENANGYEINFHSGVGWGVIPPVAPGPGTIIAGTANSAPAYTVNLDRCINVTDPNCAFRVYARVQPTCATPPACRRADTLTYLFTIEPTPQFSFPVKVVTKLSSNFIPLAVAMPVPPPPPPGPPGPPPPGPPKPNVTVTTCPIGQTSIQGMCRNFSL